jgi:hypothetical protein
MGKQNNGVTYVSQEKFDKDLNSSVDILINDGADDNTIKEYIQDYKSRFAVGKKKNSVSTTTSKETPSVSPVQPKKQSTLSVGGNPVQTGVSASSAGEVNKTHRSSEKLLSEFGFKNKEEQKKVGAVASKVKVGAATPVAVKSTQSKEDVFKTEKQKTVEQEGSLITEKYKREEEKKFVEDFRNATTVPDDFETQVRGEVLSELEGNGLWNTVSQGAVNVWNKILPYIPGAPSSKKQIEQLKSEVTFLPKAMDEYKSMLLKQGVKEDEITNDDLTKGAIDLEVKKRLDDKKLSLANDYLDNLPNNIKDRMESKALNEVQINNPEVTKKFNLIKTLDADIKEDNDELVKLEELSKKNNGLSPEDADRYGLLTASLKSKIESRNKQYNSYKESVGKLTTAEQEYDLFKRTYGFEDKAGKILNAVSDFGLGSLQFINMLTPGANQDNIALELAGIKSKKDKLVAEKFQKQVDNAKNLNDILDYGSDVLTSQSANIALGYLTGGTGMMLGMGTSAAGNRYSGLIKSNLEGETDYSKLQMYISSGIYGASETIESNTMRMIGGAKNIIGKAIKNEPYRKLLSENLASKTYKTGKEFLKNYKGEFAEELTTFTSQKISDIVVLDIDSKDAFKNAKEELKSLVKDTGVMVVGLNLFPATFSKVTKAFAPKDYTYNLDKNNKLIDQLTGVLQNKDASDIAKLEAKNKIDQIVKANEEGLMKIVKNTANIDDKLIEKVIEIESENSNLRNKAEQINSDKTISRGQKEILLSGLKEEFIKNESLREDIILGRKTSFDILPIEEQIKAKEEAATILKQEQLNKEVAEDDINISAEEINKKAIELYNQKTQQTNEESTGQTDTEEKPTGINAEQTTNATQQEDGMQLQPQEEVDKLRAEEINELKNNVENPDIFITDGKVDANKISESDNAKAKEIYAKYDKLLKPLLNNIKTKEDAVQEQSTNEGLLQPEQPEMGLQEMEQGNTEQEVVAEQGKEEVTEEVSPKETAKQQLSEAKKQINDLFSAAKEAVKITKDKFKVINNLKDDLNKFVKSNLVGLDASDITKSSYQKISSIIQKTNDVNFEEQLEKINDVIDDLYLRKQVQDEKVLNKKVEEMSKDTFYKDKSSSKVTKTKVTDVFKKKIEAAKDKFTKIANPTIADKTAFVLEMNALLKDGVRARKAIDSARKEKSSKNANKLAIIALKKDGKVSEKKTIPLNKDAVDKVFSRGGVIFNGKIYLNTKSGRSAFDSDTNGLNSADVSSVSISTTVSNAEQSRKSISTKIGDILKWYSTATFSANKFFEPLYVVSGAKEFIAKNFNDPLKVYSEKISRKVNEFRGARDSFIKDIIGGDNFISSKGLLNSKVVEVLKTAMSIYKGKEKGNPLWAFVGKNEVVFSAKIGNDVVNGTYQEIIDLFDEAIKLDNTINNQKIDFQNKYIPFDNMKNEGVAALFNMIRQPDGLAKFLNSYSMEDAKAVVNYVNGNPKIREVADKSTGLFESIRGYVNPTLDKLGYNTLGESKYIPREQALAALEGKDARSTEEMYDLLDLIYPNGLPENIPYYPLSADALAGTNDGNFIEFFENDDSENPNADYSLLFPSLFSRKAGGNLNLNNLSITGSFDNVSKDAITLVEGSDIVNDVRSVYASEGSNVAMNSSFGKSWNESFKKKVLNIIKDDAYDISSRSSGVIEKALNAWVVTRSLLRAGQLAFNTFSAASQLTGIPVAYSKEGNFKYMKDTVKNILNSSTRKEELDALKKAYKAIVTSTNYIERVNKRKDNAEVAAIKSVNDKLGYRVAGATLSDLLLLTTLFDQISLIALAPIYKGKYANNGEYNNPDNMDNFFAEEVNKTLQSNAPYYTGTAFYSNTGLALGLGGYLQSPRQIAELITEDVSAIARKEGNYTSKIKRIIALGSLGLFLPVFLKDMLRGFDDDDDEEESKADKRTSYLQTANKLSDSMLEAFGFGGTAISGVKNAALTKYSPDVMEMNVNPSEVKSTDVFVQVVKGMSPNISITLRGLDDMIDRKEIYTTTDQFAFGVETTFGFPAAKIKKQIDYMVAAGSEYYDYNDYWDLFSGKVTQAEFKEYEKQLGDFTNTLDKAVYPKDNKNGTLNTSFLNKKQLNELSKMSFEHKAEYIEDIRMNLMRKSIVEQVEMFKKNNGIDKGKGYYKVRESKIKEDLSNDVYDLLKNKYYNEDNVANVNELRVKLKGFMKDNNISEEAGYDILKQAIKKAEDKIIDEITIPIVKQIKNYSKGRDRAKFIYNNIGDLKVEDKIRYIQLMGDDFDEDTQNEYLNIMKSKQ